MTGLDYKGNGLPGQPGDAMMLDIDWVSTMKCMPTPERQSKRCICMIANILVGRMGQDFPAGSKYGRAEHAFELK